MIHSLRVCFFQEIVGRKTDLANYRKSAVEITQKSGNRGRTSMDTVLFVEQVKYNEYNFDNLVFTSLA